MIKNRKGKKLYPLTAAQKLHFYTLAHCEKKQVLNIGTSLTIEQDLDFEVLKKAIYEAYDRCESMRIRFTTDKAGNPLQYVADKETREIEHFDFTGWQSCHTEDKMKEWTAIPFDKEDSPMNRIVMIKMPDGYQGLYMQVDHRTMDAQSLIVFLKDVIELYCHYSYEGINYPKPMASYLTQLEKDLAYENGCTAKERDIEFFEKLIKSSEPIYCDIYGADKLLEERRKLKNPKLRAATNVTGSVDANITLFELEEEPSRRLNKFCEDKQISMVCLLMMGLRTFLQKENKIDDVSINTTVARRATLMEKKSGGTRIHCFPFRTIVSEEESFMDGIFKIRDGQNQLFRHANYNSVSYFETRGKTYPISPEQTYETMSLTYQPLTLQDKGISKLGDIKYKTAWYTNGAAAQTLYLTVMHRATDNGLNFSFEYQTGAVSPERLEYVYYYLCKILFYGIDHPDSTVGEILKNV